MMRSLGRACLLAAVLSIPSPALALCLASPGAVVYEVAETIAIRPGGPGRRDATATLVGWIQAGTPICPGALGPDPCAVTLIASNSVRLDTGLGSIRGDFFVVVQGDNPDDGPELVVVEGSIRGAIDFTPALLGQHVALLTDGRLQGRGAQGTPLAGQKFEAEFSGTAYLPYDDPGPSYACPSGPQPVTDNEKSLGIPTVRLEITFQ
jgi:hypothetical protein